MSYCWSPERGDQHFPICCPPWGSCRHQGGHASAFSSLSWTSQVTSATTSKSCPQDLSPLWLPSSGHTLIVWCPYIEEPKTTHSTQGGAAPVWCRVGQSQLAMLCLMHPRTQLALLAARAHSWLIFNMTTTQPPRSLSMGCSLASRPPFCTDNHDHPMENHRLPRWRIWHLLLLNFWVLVAYNWHYNSLRKSQTLSLLIKEQKWYQRFLDQTAGEQLFQNTRLASSWHRLLLWT